MIYVYGERSKPTEWVRCNLLHEFLESYQIEFKDPSTGEKVEQVVKRELVRAVYDTGNKSYGRLDS